MPQPANGAVVEDISLDTFVSPKDAGEDAEGPSWVWARVAPEDLVSIRTLEVRSAIPPSGADREPKSVATVSASLNERELPIFLVPADVAGLLRTSVKAVYTKVERGMLPGVIKDGTRVLFDRDVLLRGLRAGKGRGR
jgi:hypothetical protein